MHIPRTKVLHSFRDTVVGSKISGPWVSSASAPTDKPHPDDVLHDQALRRAAGMDETVDE